MTALEHVATALATANGAPAGGEPVAGNGGPPHAREDHAASDAALLVALVAGKSYRATAEVTGLSERTIQRRMSDPAFRPLVEAKRLELMDSALGQLLGSLELANLVIRNIAVRGQSDAVRLAAATALMDRALGWDRHVSLHRRIEALERAVGQR